MPKPLKSSLHHWWPRSLSQFWADSEGGMHQVSADGRTVRARPASFGANTNAHHIKLSKADTVWGESFEPIFSEADSLFPKIVPWINDLPIASHTNAPFAQRLRAQEANEDMLQELLKCAISLIVRSPRFRNSLKLTTDYYRKRMGLRDGEGDNSLVELNMRHCQTTFLQEIGRRGKFLILSSGSPEFIFGDGFMHNFVSAANAPSLPFFVIPFTPTRTILFTAPLMYTSEPKLSSVHLAAGETTFLNCLIQIYSKNFIFYRKDKPEIIKDFSEKEHRELRFHQHPWLDSLMASIAAA